VAILYNSKELCISIPHNQVQICRISGKQIIPFNQSEQLKTPCAFSARQSRSLNGHRRAESQEMKRLPCNAAYVSTTSKVFNTIAKITKYKPAETTKNHKATAPSHAVVRGDQGNDQAPQRVPIASFRCQRPPRGPSEFLQSGPVPHTT
jgi:hypothetical protein